MKRFIASVCFSCLPASLGIWGEKIIIVDNEGKTIAGEEEPSPYNSSTIDNNSAFTTMISIGIMVTKAKSEYVLSNSNN